MKKLLLITLIAFLSQASWSQYTWSMMSAGTPNPDFTNPMDAMDVVMTNNRLYHVYDSSGLYTEVAVYNPESGQWTTLASISSTNYTNGIQAALYNGDIYFVQSSYSGMRMNKFSLSNNTITPLATYYNYSYFGSNWEFKISASGALFVANVDNYTSIYLNYYSIANNTWSAQNVTAKLNSSSQYLNGSSLELYTSNTDVYLGVSGGTYSLGMAPISTISAFDYYNTTGSNNGLVYLNSATSNMSFYLSGNGQTAPTVTVENTTTGISYEKTLTTNDVNVIPGLNPSIDFNISGSDHFLLENTAYLFLMSEFSSQGSTNQDKFYVYRKDLATGLWDSLGPKIEFTPPYMNTNSARISLESTLNKHLAVMYRSTSSNGGATYNVLNQRPNLIPASATATSGMCLNHENQIYAQLELQDDDLEKVRILNISGVTGVFSNLYAVGVGYDNSSVPAISKFAIYGTAVTSGTDQLTITYTDGWNIFTETLPSITVVNAAPSISFIPLNPVFCNNETQIDLTAFVNYVDQGTFRINGANLQGSIIDGTVYSVNAPNGTLQYRINVGGCIVETSANYTFATVGTATTNSTTATCGLADGTATVTYTPGTATSYTVEWSTGESTPTITGLNPGAYYYHVTDNYGCHVTGFSSVATTGITVNATIHQISCYGANNGSISATVSGPANYSTVWSNGYSTSAISNLSPGNYWLTVTDLSNGCQTTSSYNITEPASITASFSTYDPDCGLSNGIIYGNYSGGSGSLTFNWLVQGQTTPDLTAVSHGYYQVQVSDGNSCQQTFGFQLDDYQAVDILDSTALASCGNNDGAIFIQFQQDQFGGTLANSFTWSNGNGLQDNFNLTAGDYTITVVSGPSFNNNWCYSSKTIHVGNKAPLRQDICLVTVDTATTTNLIVWEKIESDSIDHYNIYRENAVAGDYALIDTVQFSNTSAFNDVVASAMDRSWRYCISAVNVCGVEGPLSVEHKTLHLNTIDVLGNGTVNVLWDDYEGTTSATEYVIWRKTDQTGWSAISPSVPLGTTSYTDSPPVGSTGLDYYIEMVLSAPCTAQKAQDFNTTRSNKDKGSFVAGEGVNGNSNNGMNEENISLLLYPNPATDALTITVSENGIHKSIHILTVDGQEVLSIKIDSPSETLSVEQLANGIYFLQIEGKNEPVPFVKK